jgi:8-oxo-dGTP pyrophosphatase MutT (NUDIX family)
MTRTPLKQSAAGCVIRDEVGKIMVVEPVYKDMWEIPGGQIEEGESPREACEREVDEELGLVLHVGELLCIDYVRSRDSYRFVFDGGVVDQSMIDSICLPPDELLSYRFVALEEAAQLVNPRLGRRLRAIGEASTGRYLEDAERPNAST